MNKKNIKLLYLYIFWSSLSFERVIWMLYLTHIGWQLMEISVLQAILNLTQMFLEVPSGYIADRIGKKFSMSLGHIFVILYLFTYFFAQIHAIFFLGFILYGIGLSLISGTDQSILYESLDSKDSLLIYSKFMGRYTAIATIAIAISSALGGFISKIDWFLVFVLSIIFQIVALLIVQFLSDRKTSDLKKINLLADIRNFLSSRTDYRYVIFTIAILQSSISILYQYGSILLKEVGCDTSVISLSFMVLSIISVGASISVFYFNKILGVNKTIWLSLVMTIPFFLFLTINNQFLIIISFVFINILFEIWDTSLNSVLQNSISSVIRTSLVSICNLLTALFMAIESLSLGYLNKVFGIQNTFIIIGILAIGISLVTFYRFYKLNSNTKKV